MVRSSTSNTIISYHPGPDHATAHALHARLNTAGNSGHWNTIFANNDDPTFVILILLWYALYAWDEAFEVLYKHIGWLVSLPNPPKRHLPSWKLDYRNLK